VGAKSYSRFMAKRRGYGEDGIYFDHRGDCRDSVHHKACAGRWCGVVSLGFGADGKPARRKVSGPTKAAVRDKLKELHAELDAGIRTVAGYTVEQAVADWLADGLPGRTAKTADQPARPSPDTRSWPAPGTSRRPSRAERPELPCQRG